MAGFCVTNTPFTLFPVHFQYQEKRVFPNNLHLGAKITKANSKCKELQPLVRQTNHCLCFCVDSTAFFLFFLSKWELIVAGTNLLLVQASDSSLICRSCTRTWQDQIRPKTCLMFDKLDKAFEEKKLVHSKLISKPALTICSNAP